MLRFSAVFLHSYILPNKPLGNIFHHLRFCSTITGIKAQQESFWVAVLVLFYIIEFCTYLDTKDIAKDN